MSKPNTSFSRRKFLKGAAYASALSVGSASALSAANAMSSQPTTTKSTAASTVTLMNQSNRAIVLDATQPVTLEKVHGWVVVKINKAPANGIALAAGQQGSFTVDSELAPALKDTGGHIVITNEYSELDNMVPMATYDVVVV